MRELPQKISSHSDMGQSRPTLTGHDTVLSVDAAIRQKSARIADFVWPNLPDSCTDNIVSSFFRPFRSMLALVRQRVREFLRVAEIKFGTVSANRIR